MGIEEFMWDERSAQPVQIGGRISNFLRGIRYIFPMLNMCTRNLLHMPGAYARFRRYRRNSVSRKLPDFCTGLAVSWDEHNCGRIIQACKDLNPGSVLVRVLSWRKDIYEPVCQFVRDIGLSRDQVVIAVIQDRACIKHPDLWRERFGRIVELFSPCARYFQIGQAPNRKKWGIYSPREYIRICRESAALKNKTVEYVGPSIIDFELNYTDMILSSVPETSFQIVNSLLYVDRRGMPENKQWPSFDLPNKIRAIRAVADRAGFAEAPFWITETNWPIRGTGYDCPAGKGVRVNEQEYADYLLRYYILAFATGIPERIFWWELCARGYGLVDPSDGGFRKRDGYYAFKKAASFFPGSENSGYMHTNGLHTAAFRRDAYTVFAVWHTEKRVSFPLKAEPEAVTTAAGNECGYNGSIEITTSPLFIRYNREISIEEAFAV